MQIVYKFANYNLIEADNFRIAVANQNISFLKKEKKNFIQKSIKNGHILEIINKIYNYILNFSNYVFNKSHSISYALISYRMSFLKANYNQAFILIFLNHFINDLIMTQNLMKEKSNQNQFILPNIKISQKEYYILNDQIVIPLTLIKEVNNIFYEKLLEERKKKCFKNYEDFKKRLQPFLNNNLLDNLIFSGALDIFDLNRKTLFKNKNLENLEYQQNIKNFQPIEYTEFSALELKIKMKQAFKLELLDSQININY